MESNKVFKKEIIWGLKTISISSDRIKLFEEVIDSYNKLDTELMESNFTIVKREIEQTLNDNKTLNEFNSELSFNSSYYKNQISKYGNITPYAMDLIYGGKMNVGKLKANQYIKKQVKRKIIENQSLIVENKNWLKILKFLKEKLRIYIYESKLTC